MFDYAPLFIVVLPVCNFFALLFMDILFFSRKVVEI
jgi:hypothetical protein